MIIKKAVLIWGLLSVSFSTGMLPEVTTLIKKTDVAKVCLQQTAIYLLKDVYYRKLEMIDGRVDYIVLGIHEQNRLKNIPRFYLDAAELYDIPSNRVFIKKKEVDSNSIDDTYNAFRCVILLCIKNRMIIYQ